MIIEMRTYTLQPGTVATFEERFAEALPVRAKVSPLAAFWHTEVGPLNRVIHVWPYENLEERTRLRAEATKLQGWPPNTREFVVEQQSDIYLPALFSPKLEPRQLGGLYEIRIYTFKPGGIPATIDRWSTQIAERTKLSPFEALGIPRSAASTNGATSGPTRMRASVSVSVRRQDPRASGRPREVSPA